MDKDIKTKCIEICERWLGIVRMRKEIETTKHIFAVLDVIDGATTEKQRQEAKQFLSSIKQTQEVKEVRAYVKKRKETDRGVSLF